MDIIYVKISRYGETLVSENGSQEQRNTNLWVGWYLRRKPTPSCRENDLNSRWRSFRHFYFPRRPFIDKYNSYWYIYTIFLFFKFFITLKTRILFDQLKSYWNNMFMSRGWGITDVYCLLNYYIYVDAPVYTWNVRECAREMRNGRWRFIKFSGSHERNDKSCA